MCEGSSVVLGLPFCQDPREQTDLSLGLRVMVVVLGTIVAIGGILMALNVSGLVQYGTTAGWGTFSVGAAVALIAISIKGVKTNEMLNDSLRTLSYVDHTPPKDFVSSLPPFLQTFTNIPYVHFPAQTAIDEDIKGVTENQGVIFDDFKNIANPVVLFSAGPTVGMHLRLNIRHIPVDTTYNRAPGTGSVKPTDFFTLQAIAWKPDSSEQRWILSSDNTVDITHRNAQFVPESILSGFTYQPDNELNLSEIQALCSVEKQDQVDPKARYNLQWLMPRLLNKDSVQIREKRINLSHASFEDDAVGYWEIFLVDHD